MANPFQIITGDIGGFERCCLYYDTKKNKWIQSGKHQGRDTMLVFLDVERYTRRTLLQWKR